MTIAEPIAKELALEERNIILALLYFDIFNYPLTAAEIRNFAPQRLSLKFQSSLNALLDKGLIFNFEDYYSLHNSIDTILRRKAGNALAKQRMQEARRFSKLIACFPFVRAVMLSGSISKNYMDENSDIDYFIITEKGRLWMARVALVMFRRFFLHNSRKSFCTNYFIDSENLEIEEKNIFTSVEVATLKPMYGNEYVSQFQRANQWLSSYLPNSEAQSCEDVDGSFQLKKWLESILSLSIFNYVEQWLMNQSVKHWKKKYKHLLNDKDFEIAFQSKQGASRSHPNFFQKKVLSLYNAKIAGVEAKGVKIIDHYKPVNKLF